MVRLQNLELLKKKVSPEVWQAFAQECGLCPECLIESLTISRDEPKEVVCSRCGLVIGLYFEAPSKLPGHGTDTTYNDTCQLAFGKSLGSHLRKFQTYSVLAKSSNGKKDLGLRAVQIKNLLHVESLQVRNMLFHGSQLCKQHGLSGKDERSIKFADELGKILRVAGATALVLTRGSIRSKHLAESCFIYLYEKTLHNGHGLRQELGVKPETLEWVRTVLERYSLPKPVELFTKRHESLPEAKGYDDSEYVGIINPKWPQKFPMIITVKRSQVPEQER